MANESKGNGWIVGFLVVAAVALVLKWWTPPQPTVEESAKELSRMIQERNETEKKLQQFLPR